MPEEENSSQDIGYQKVSKSQLKFSYWYVTHKLQIRKMWMVLLIVLNIGLFSFVIWRIIDLYFVTYNDHRQLLYSLSQDLVPYATFRQINAPTSLEVIDTKIVIRSGGLSDVFVRIKNPNLKHTVKNLEYILFSDGKIIAQGETFILPDSEKFILAYNIEELNRSSSVDLQFGKIDWRRVNFYEREYDEKFNFEIVETEFVRPADSSIAGKVPISIGKAKIRNNSAFNYWKVGFFIAAYSGQTLSGVNYSSVDQFRSGETREAEARWFTPLGNISRLEVIPDVNFLDPSTIMYQ